MRVPRSLRLFAALLTGFLLVLGTVVGVAPAQAAKPSWHGSYIQVTKVSPDTVTARIRCPLDPNPNGTQHFFLTATRADGTHVSYSADVVQYCDMRRHHVTLQRTTTDAALVPGERVDLYGSIAGDGGEVNVWYTGWKVQR
jgi:hypothetical protein